jgi:hypothetical protein
MIEFLAPFVCQIYSSLTRMSASMRSDGWATAEIHPTMKEAYVRLDCLVAIQQHADVLNDTDLQFRVLTLQNRLRNQESFTGEIFARELEGLFGQVMVCVSKHKFARIPSPNDQYFEQEQLFGGLVFALFPNSRQDIKDAGNCIAAQLYTASVFHLMRACEDGLRSLARKLRVKLTDKGKPQPIDTATWEKVITQVRNKLNKAHTLAKGNPKRAADIMRYADLLDRCQSLKDLYRNPTMHARSTFDYHQAASVLERSKEFMQALAGL